MNKLLFTDSSPYSIIKMKDIQINPGKTIIITGTNFLPVSEINENFIFHLYRDGTIYKFETIDSYKHWVNGDLDKIEQEEIELSQEMIIGCQKVEHIGVLAMKYFNEAIMIDAGGTTILGDLKEFETNKRIDYESKEFLDIFTNLENCDIKTEHTEELEMFKKFNCLKNIKDLSLLLKEYDGITNIGRGSSVGSKLLYELGIHKVDGSKIKPQLSFERFLSDDRLVKGELPDIDLDSTQKFIDFIYKQKEYGNIQFVNVGVARKYTARDTIISTVEFLLGPGKGTKFAKDFDLKNLGTLDEKLRKNTIIYRNLEKNPIWRNKEILNGTFKSLNKHASGIIFTNKNLPCNDKGICEILQYDKFKMFKIDLLHNTVLDKFEEEGFDIDNELKTIFDGNFDLLKTGTQGFFQLDTRLGGEIVNKYFSKKEHIKFGDIVRSLALLRLPFYNMEDLDDKMIFQEEIIPLSKKLGIDRKVLKQKLFDGFDGYEYLKGKYLFGYNHSVSYSVLVALQHRHKELKELKEIKEQ